MVHTLHELASCIYCKIIFISTCQEVSKVPEFRNQFPALQKAMDYLVKHGYNLGNNWDYWYFQNLEFCFMNFNSISYNHKFISRMDVLKKFLVKLPLDEFYKTSLMISQYWFSWWLGVIRHQAITWTNVDQALWWHMASQVQNELTHWEAEWCKYASII